MVAVAGDMTEPTGSGLGYAVPVEPPITAALPLSSTIDSVPLTQESKPAVASWTGEVFVIKLRDTSGLSIKTVLQFVCPATLSFGEFLKDVSERSCVSPDICDVVYQTPGQDFCLNQLPENSTFDSIGVFPNPDKTYQMVLMKKKNLKQRSSVRDLTGDLEEAAGTSESSSRPSEPMSTDSSYIEENEQEPVYVAREFVGLKNQHLTCYLNSLVQSMFFCPEFRNLIYNQVIEYDPRRKSIIAAFQKLFLQLQFSCRHAIETDEITKTFGWKESENCIQHDIEELYRILMESMSEEFKFIGKPALTESLYGGIMNDYVECLNCHKRNSKKELFLALSLPVRAYGKPLPEPTMIEAIRAFVQFELLDGENQYHCSNCESLQDARKGLCFQKLPYIMCVQLRRTEFDLVTMTRKKVNDRVEYPFVLDMNEFMEAPNESDQEDSTVIHPLSAADIGPARRDLVRASHSRPGANVNENEGLENENGENVSIAVNKKPVKKYRHSEAVSLSLQNGPNVYQLLGVLVHRGGSSHSGHYYTYVYDLEKHQWYSCNDHHVKRISEIQIFETYGGRSGIRIDDEREGQAYMLIYRKVDPILNSLPMTIDELPTHVRNLWTSLEQSDRDQYDREMYEKSIFTFPVYVRVDNAWEIVDCHKEMVIQKNDTMETAAYKCFKTFFPDKEIQMDCIRLVRFNPEPSFADESWPGSENLPIGEVYRRPRDLDQVEALLLEIKTTGFEFDVYSTRDLAFKASLGDSTAMIMLKSIEVHASAVTSVGEFRAKLATIFNLPIEDLALMVRMDCANRLLTDDSRFLNYYGVGRYSEVVVEVLEDGDYERFGAFIDEWFQAMEFVIDCEVPSTYFLEDQEAVSCGGKGSTGNSTDQCTEQRVDPEPCIQFEFDPPENAQTDSVECADGVLELPRDCSDHSASEDSSLTGSERTMVGPGSPSCSYAGQDVVGSEDSITDSRDPLENQTVPVLGEINEVGNATEDNSNEKSIGNKVEPKELYFRVTGQVRLYGSWQRFHVRVNRQMTFSSLSKKIEKLIGVNESDFIMYRVEKDRESEIIYDFDNTLNYFENLEMLRVRLGHRLLENEARFPVFLLRLPHTEEDPQPLNEVVLNSSMTGEAALSTCIKMVSDLKGKNKVKFDPTCCRIRRKKGSNPAKIMKPYMKLVELFPSMRGDIYFQPLESPDMLGPNQHSILIRQFHPKTLSLDPPFEFVLTYDYQDKIEVMLRDQLTKYTGIESIECAVPETEYPFDMNPVAVLEKLIWYSLEQGCLRRSVGVYHDEAVMFIRDSMEPAAEITVELRRAYEMNNQNSFTFSSPPSSRSEPGIRINLARTPPA